MDERSARFRLAGEPGEASNQSKDAWGGLGRPLDTHFAHCHVWLGAASMYKHCQLDLEQNCVWIATRRKIKSCD